MRGEVTIPDRPHHLDLELEAAKALSKKQYARAFELSDRRCRIEPSAQSHAYILRAESSFRLGRQAYAISDLDAALALSPDDKQANRRMLAWSSGERQRRAARALLNNESDTYILRHAVDVLEDHEPASFASLTVMDRTIEGWAAWSGPQAVTVSIISENNVISFFIEPDPFHVLSNSRRCAASFNVARPRSSNPQSITVSMDGRPIYSTRAPGNASPTHARIWKADTSEQLPTVIIPVFGDFTATKACLKSVSKALRHRSNFQVVIIDDDTPDGRIKSYIAAFAHKAGFRLLTNSQNLGFVGSINRALRTIRSGDVVLLNSDTLVPPGFVDRLAATARFSDDIGTVMPLSNNGEFSSFPIPNQSNKLGTYEDVLKLDRLAAAANDVDPIDLPSGIGFCLYITRECLNAVGELSEHYARGYFEDVDFSLRARESGFRSVCATSTYVGHVGTRSFKLDKRSLVIRNFDVLDSRFPNYRHECLAFTAADALRPAREAIERLFADHDIGPTIILTPPGAQREIADARSQALLKKEQSPLLFEFSSNIETIIKPINPAGVCPQNIRFVISKPEDRKRFDQYLKSIKPAKFEILSSSSLPPQLLDLIADSHIPYEILIVDGSFFDPPKMRPPAESLGQEHINFKSENADRPPMSTTDAWRHRWANLLKGANSILFPCAMARAYASAHLPVGQSIVLQPLYPVSRPRKRPSSARLGILACRKSIDDLHLIHRLTRGLLDLRPTLPIIVLGETLNDQFLMTLENTFVTGPIEAEKLKDVLFQYEIGSLMLGLSSPLFGHPLEIAAMRTGFPIARFDWSGGTYRPPAQDLSIPVETDAPCMAELLSHWLRGART